MNFLNNVRQLLVGIYRIMIAMIVIIVTLPVFYLIDYQKLCQFVKRYGIRIVASLMMVLAICDWTMTKNAFIKDYIAIHPNRLFIGLLVSLLMLILEADSDKIRQFFE